MNDRVFDFVPIGTTWLHEAREHLKLFDAGHTASIFYAALALRMGIEARLHEYIQAAAPQDRVKDYNAKKLLMKLRERSSHAQKDFHITFRPQQDGESVAFFYAGISDALVEAHGKLGDLLHATFFGNHPDWCHRFRLREKIPPDGSLLNVRDWLEEVAKELDKAIRGNLLAVRGTMFEALFDD